MNANLTEFQSSTKLLCLFNYLQRNIFVNPLENRLHFKLNNVGIDDKNYFSGATAYSKDVIIAEAGLSLRKKLLQHSEESLGGSSRLKLSLEDLGAFDVAVKSEISKLELLLSSRSKDNEHGTLNIYEDSNKGDLSARSAGSKRSITSISAENPVLSNYSVINELNSSMVSRDESVNTSNSNFLAASLLRLRIQGKRQSSGLSSDVSIVSDEGKRTEFSTNISIDVHAKDSTGSGISSPVTFETSCSFSPNNVDKGNFSDDEDDNSTTVERAEYVAKSVEHPKVVQSTPFIAKLAIQKPEIAIDGVSQEPVVQSSASTDEFTISFLGTGCATPSKYRNNACILVDIHIKNIHECGNFATTPTLGGSTDSAEVFLTLPKFKSRRVGSFDRDSDHNQSKTFINKHYSHTSTQHNIPQVLPPGDKSESPILLLDCGESTSIQMFRKANGSLEEFDKMLLRIKVVWISHHHADHVCGFPALIQQIHRARMRMKVKDCTNTSNCNNAFVIKRPFFVSDCSPNKILVVANESVLHYFEYVCNVAGIDSNLICYYPIKNSLYNGITKDISIVTNNYVTSLKSIPVLHCHQSYGVVITLRNGKVIVYSGDCRPSQTLAKAGYNCDLLIHEATFDNSSLHDETDCQFTSNGKDGVKSFQADAIKKKHCTVDEAVAIGRQMNAKFIFLTHFSQRSTISMVNTTRTIYGTQGSGLKCDNFHDRMIARGQAPCPVEYDFSKADSCAYDSRSSQLDSSFGSQSGLNEYYLNSYGGYAPRIEPPAICQLVNPSITTNISSYQRNDVNNSSKSNIFVAYDLMTVSYPSQMQKLAEGIQNLSESLAALKRLSSNSHY